MYYYLTSKHSHTHIPIKIIEHKFHLKIGNLPLTLAGAQIKN